MSFSAESPPVHWADQSNLPPQYLECDQPLLELQQWPANLLQLAEARGGQVHKLLRGTGLFPEDFSQRERLVSAAQCFSLIDNCLRQCDSASRAEISFLLGHQLLPGHLGELSNQLVYARNLQEFLELLVLGRQGFSPLLSPRLEWRGDYLWLHWLDAFGAGPVEKFLQEMMCAAIASCSRWLAGQRFDWRFYFPAADNRAAEACAYEEYQVHLGGSIQFNAPGCAMVISREQAFSQWPRGSHPPLHQAPRSAALAHCPGGFRAEVYRYLRSHIGHNPDLDSCAAAFCMSSASLKRKLQKHQSHFQAVYDQVRRDLALHWLATQQLSNDQLAQRLHFHDAANLRRAFKKWTGFTPSESRALSLY